MLLISNVSLTGLILLVLFDPIILMSLAALKNVKDLRGQHDRHEYCLFGVQREFCFVDFLSWIWLVLFSDFLCPSCLFPFTFLFCLHCTRMLCYQPLSCWLHPTAQCISCVHCAHLPLWNLFVDFFVLIFYLLKYLFMLFSFPGCTLRYVKVINSHKNLGHVPFSLSA